MSDTPSERRLAENEVIFRQLNETLLQNIDETNRIAIEDKQPEYLIDFTSSDELLHFFCECSDEKCKKRVELSLPDYKKIHVERDCFTVIPGHEIKSIEHLILDKYPRYYVVKKKHLPPKNAQSFNPTSLNNA